MDTMNLLNSSWLTHLRGRVGLVDCLLRLILSTLCWGDYSGVPDCPPENASSPSPIKNGYTAFGDSYAAGIGTGNSTTWGCRQGRFSHPDLIASTARDIDFQNLACSGATLQNIVSGGANSQVDAWINPNVADIATISIGGNDIGFYNILTACVLRVEGPWAGDCDTELAKAYEILAKPDFAANITSALVEIIEKNGNSAFRVFMTGYVLFFNATTPLCESSSFRIWNPHYDKSHEEKDQPWLTTGLRTQLNDVVVALNLVLSQVADSVNAYYTNVQRVIFVDPNPAFVGHRWCENGVYEPDNDRSNTWLFLSSTPDNNFPDKPLGDKKEESDLKAGPSFLLPDPTTCRETLATSESTVRTDWYENMICGISIAASDPSTYEYQVMREEEVRIEQGNFTELRIPWYVPTKLAKTFHPKTLGQQAFANEIMAAW